MEIYMSEEERLEALKKWWKENARAILIGISLGLAVIAGWNTWQNTQLRKSEEASGVFQQLLKAVEGKQTEPATKLSERLIENYQGSTYATYGALFLAKLKADAGDLSGAKKILQDLLAATKDENIKHIARLRLGRVMLAQGESEAALPLLEPLKRDQMGEFESQYEDLKGDLYVDLHRYKDAKIAYEKAMQEGEATPMLEIKINSLPDEPVAKP